MFVIVNGYEMRLVISVVFTTKEKAIQFCDGRYNILSDNDEWTENMHDVYIVRCNVV